MANQIKQWYINFRPHEKLLACLLIAAFAVSTIMILGSLQERVSTTVPHPGGDYTEGIVGFARYVNPVLANTDPDKDVTELVYAGLTKRSADGSIVPDLATDFSANSSQTEYTFQIDPQATFHDGHPVRAEDVVFTIDTIKDPSINSPKRAQWQEVDVTAVNDTTVTFTTDKPFAGLPVNATVGILPKHLWQDESSRSFAFSRLNTQPVGAGPYQVQNVRQSANGTPSVYRLTPHEDYVGGAPYIRNLTLRFYPDNQRRRRAFEDGQVDGMYGIDPAYARELQQQGIKVGAHQFNRVFSVFFNQNNNQALTSQAVRTALADAIPKDDIVASALSGFGETVPGPLPLALAGSSTVSSATSTSTESSAEKLREAGWEINNGVRSKDGERLSVTLTTVDIPSLQKAVNLIRARWEELGIAVETQALSPNELTRQVVRPRNYEALLFGQSVGNIRDLYSFWHSSRQEDPGLNLAQYANSDVDQALEQLRQATSSQQIARLRDEIASTIQSEQPAAFVFSPSFIYVLPDKLKNTAVPSITQAADRFANISNWYTETSTLWNIFVDKQNQ